MKATAKAALSWIGVVATVALPAARAWACTWEYCLDSRFYPEEIQAMPANAPGPALFPITLVQASDLELEERLAGMTFQWLDEDGNPVPHQAMVDQGVIVLKAEQALEAGRVYTVDYPNECRGLVQRRTFLASDAADWPSLMPPVSSTPPAIEPVVVLDYAGGCTQTLSAAVSRIDVDWMPGFRDWDAILRVRTIVDDVVWTVSEPGFLRYGHEGLPVYPRGEHGERRADVLYTVCERTFGAYHIGLEPGTHRVRVEFLLPGHETVMVAPEFDVTLTCDDTGGDVTEGGDDVAPCAGGSDGCVATAHPGRDGGLGALWLLVFLVLPRVVARGRRRWRAARVPEGRRLRAGEDTP